MTSLGSFTQSALFDVNISDEEFVKGVSRQNKLSTIDEAWALSKKEEVEVCNKKFWGKIKSLNEVRLL